MGVDLKEFASTYDTQTEKVNTEDQVKTAGSPGENRPNLLVQIYFYHQDTMGGVTFDTTIQEYGRPQDGGHRVGDRMLRIRDPNGHGRVKLIISGYRGGLDTYIRDPHHQATHSVTTLSYTCLLMMTRGSTTSAGTQDQFCQ